MKYINLTTRSAQMFQDDALIGLISAT